MRKRIGADEWWGKSLSTHGRRYPGMTDFRPDIVERLRRHGPHDPRDYDDAAAEIEHLRKALREVLDFCDETLLTDSPDFHLAIMRAKKLLSESSGE